MKSKYIKHLILFSLMLICSKVNAIYFEVDGLRYITISDSEVEVRKGSKTSGTLTIPESVTYNDIIYSVTSIGNYAFQHCSGFSGSLTIPNSVTSIGQSAFESCSGFTGSLTIPNSVTSIGECAFHGCSGFTGSLTIPNSVISIGAGAFQNCSGFSGSLTISNSLTSIEQAVFYDCSGFIGTLTIPNSVTSIEYGAFHGCSGFTGSLTIPNSVTSIGQFAFRSCSGFTGSLTISNSVTSIGDYTFYNCSGFTGSLTIPNSVISIGDYAFQDCSSFTGSLIIPNSVTKIGKGAFWNCSGFTGSLTIPNSVTSIGNYAFSGCSGFTGSLTIPNSVTSIEQYAFGGCSGFTGSLTIPNSVTSIGHDAFFGCSGFTGSLTIPNSVTKIESEAFLYCSGFTGDLTIPNSVTSIGENAFNGCSGFTGSLILSNSVTSIGSGAFNGCSGFTGSLTIPNSVTSIGQYAFSGCSGFTGSLTIPNSVKTIEEAAFSHCSGFTGSLTIPNSVTSIGQYAFSGCSGFTGSLTIPNSVKTIEEAAFSHCSGFTGSLTIPNSVTSIGERAFWECSGLTSIVIPNSVTSIGNQAFYCCSNLSTVITKIEEPFTIKEVFLGISSDAILQVPKGTMGKYEQFSGWTNNFKEFIEDKGSASNTYSLSMKSTGNGSISYKNITTKNKKRTFVLDAGESATINFSSDDGYRIKDAKLNNTDITSQVLSNNQYTISKISENTTLDVEFGRAYTLTIKSTGNGVTTYNGSNIREQSSTFPVTEGTSAVVSFTPDAGYRIKKVKLGYSDVTASVTNNQYTISNFNSNTTLEVEYERITFVLSIRATGNGSVMYENTSTRGRTNTFNVVEGSDVTLTITADTDNRIKSVKVDSEDVTSSVKDGKYTISNFRENKTVEVVFEAIPTYSLNILAKGNGNVGYNGNTIRNQSLSYSVKEGSSAILSFTPDSGYRLTNVKKDNADVTGQISDGKLTINNIISNTSIEVTFEAIPPTTYTLTIKSTGNGTATYEGTTVRGKSSQFTVTEGTYATVTFTPDTDYRIKSVKVNNADVTASVVDNQFTINKISANTSLEVEFTEDFKEITSADVNYKVVSYEQQTINLESGDYGLTLTVPATVTAYDRVWNVVGVEADALNLELAAIIWNPEVEFNGVVNNPNLLLYVKNKQYAPNTIKNVVVNGEAEEITLVDAQSGNNFYCPQAFTAKKVSYEHHYGMTTGYNTCQGWETIVLPFDVATILNATAQEIVPYAIWDESSNLRTFWLYNLTVSGWQAANSIKANTPYIISMPNNENYDASYNITGNIQFIGNNVQIKASDNLSAVKSGNKSFVPNYQYQETSSSIYALNVNNQWNTNTSAEAEGSTFIRSLRAVRPFEAYLTVEGGTSAPNYIPVFGDVMPTGIDAKLVNSEGVNSEKWYSLDGRKLQGKPTTKGLYIVNGRKVVVK